ncbi:imelysin family protein [Shewanella sp. WXL01]|uniref:imelysin family protein n=1 Tax=Shewanella sp. WXL01 TaxID=2709721 RepID=UPI001438572A|nr:imelysin family protein [Shewanella sp. WXL01]NKF49326.1 imelysin family protein [Shewanella sp. WXL01]
MQYRTVLSSLFLAMTAALASGCGESTSSEVGPDYGNGGDTTGDFDQAALVANIVDGVITPTFEQFAQVSSTQQQQLSAMCSAESAFQQGNVDQNAYDQAVASAKQSWRDAMTQWQRVELMQIGPLLANDGALRNKIYSWPVKSSCGVDLDVVSFEKGDINGVAYDIATRTPARKGMLALEHLLFSQSLEHTCTGSVVPDGWDNRTDDSRRIARCEFAVEVATDINNNASELVSEWTAADGYAAKLKQAGTAGSEFETVHAAVNKLSDALFYIDSVTKDAKLATPLGQFANSCGTSVCVEDVESPIAMHSIENIVSNLQALKALYQGDEGIGFDDYLIDEDAQETADKITTAIDAAIADASAYQASLSQTLTDNEQQVITTHGEVKAVTDQLKSDFINTLALELPQTSAGDND